MSVFLYMDTIQTWNTMYKKLLQEAVLTFKGLGTEIKHHQ